jgi:hypothetical protein
MPLDEFGNYEVDFYERDEDDAPGIRRLRKINAARRAAYTHSAAQEPPQYICLNCGHEPCDCPPTPIRQDVLICKKCDIENCVCQPVRGEPPNAEEQSGG